MRTAPGSPPAYLCAAAALAVSLLAASCSGHVPELGGVEFRLAVRPPAPGGGRGAEQLAVFVAARDKDGFRDLAALHILHDVEELLWTLTPETWTRGDLGKETWIGATGLSVPEVGTLPRGLYRVILEDLAGDSDTISFTLGSGLERGAAFPTLRRIGDSVAVASRHARTELLFLDTSGNLLRAVGATAEPVLLDRLYGSPGWRSEARFLVAYAYDAERNLGLFSWTLDLVP